MLGERDVEANIITKVLRSALPIPARRGKYHLFLTISFIFSFFFTINTIKKKTDETSVA